MSSSHVDDEEQNNELLPSVLSPCPSEGVAQFSLTPGLYNTNETVDRLVEITRLTNDMSATRCLITLFPSTESKLLEVAHLIPKSTRHDKLKNLRNWWGKKDFSVNSVVNVIMLDASLHTEFDKAATPQWTIVPTDEVVQEIYEEFVMKASIMSVKKREEWYNKYDIRASSSRHTYRFVPLNMLLTFHPPILRMKEPLPRDFPVGSESNSDSADLPTLLRRAAELSSLDHMLQITSPYDDKSLQNMTSHAHPFAVIMKAAEPLALYSHLVPARFHEVSRLIQLIAFKWNLPFPKSGAQVISSSKASSRRSAVVAPSNRQHRSHPYTKRETEDRQASGGSRADAGGGGVVNETYRKSSSQHPNTESWRDSDAYETHIVSFPNKVSIVSTDEEEEWSEDEKENGPGLSRVLSLLQSVVTWRQKLLTDTNL